MQQAESYFALFGLPVSWQVDDQALASRYRELQRQYHPDRFAHEPPFEQRQALAMASLVNTAFDTLRHEVSRAAYLLALAGEPVDFERNTMMDTGFLAAQMEWREELEDANSAATIRLFRQRIRRELEHFGNQFGDQYAAGSLSDAADLARKMQFLTKLLADAVRREESFDD